MDYTEESFCARFFLDGKVLKAERKYFEGDTDIVRHDQNYLVQDAYMLGRIITKEQYDKFPNELPLDD